MGGVAFNRVASSGVLATWGASTPDERREPRRRTREIGDLALAPTGRQRVSEVATSGEAPPAEGRRGSAAAESGWSGLPRMRGYPNQELLVLRQTTIAAEAATAKNRGIRRWERQRELFDPPHGNRRRTKMPRRAASAA
jgi:hypothetical protein